MHRPSHSKLANPIRASGTSQFNLSLVEQGLGPFSDLCADGADALDKQTAEINDQAALGTRRAIKDNFESPTATEPDTSPGPPNRCGSRNPKIGRFTASGGGKAATHGTDNARDSCQRFTKIEQNRRGRRSTALRLSEVRNIMAAAVFTAEEHRPLNRHTTIHFDAAGIADPVTTLRRYTKLARDWLRTQGVTFAYIWVREAGDRKGEHAHILMAVPSKLIKAFALRERSWRRLIGAKRAPGAFHSTPIGRSYRHAEVGIQYGESYSEHLGEIVSYLVKGAEPRAVEALSLTRAQFGGDLWGKRSGISENIGRAARRRTQ
jgi:hypothetical protein